ncbi:nuclear transport factor 2 family protein [Vibrio gangliei]|uniref:nuclear transport factor 2 family protein n=1 Tax=Vibrio gangliei TaxID=2077090 RepID=UPI000D01BB83|nr:nuclear transport factor 2 family protein [Vibrio gangliei]
MTQISTNINRFIETYQNLDKDHLHLLDEIYADHIQFQDPLHRVEGLHQLHQYFEHLYANVISCHFEINQTFEQREQAAVYWTMHLRHPKLNHGNSIVVDGHSHLVFSQDEGCAQCKIIHHRDYFDIGSMLYEQLPVVGSIVKFIKQKASS